MGVDVHETGCQKQPVDVKDLACLADVDRWFDSRNPSVCYRNVAVAGDVVPGVDNVSVPQDDVVCLGARTRAAHEEQRNGNLTETPTAKHAKINNSKL